MTDSDTAAQALARAVDEDERRGNYYPLAVQIPLEQWRAAQDTELGERLRDQTAETDVPELVEDHVPAWSLEVLRGHVSEIVFDAGATVDSDCVLCQQAAAEGLWDRYFDLEIPEEAAILADLRLRAIGSKEAGSR